MGLKLPVGALSWPVFSLCGLCASKHISFSFVSVHFLVRDWDSRQWERLALLKMQDLCALISAQLHLYPLELLLVVPATWAVDMCLAGSGGT